MTPRGDCHRVFVLSLFGSAKLAAWSLVQDAYVKIITWAKDYFPDIYRLHVTPSIEIWLEKELRQGPLRPFDAMQLSLYHESTAVDRGPPNGHGVDARDIAGMCFGAQVGRTAAGCLDGRHTVWRRVYATPKNTGVANRCQTRAFRSQVQDMGVAPGGMPNGIPPAFHGHAQVPVGVYPEIGQPPPANAAVGRSEAMVMHNRGGVAMSEAMAMHGDSGGAVMSEAMVMHGDKGAVGQYMLTSLARIAEMAQPSRLSDAGGGFAGTHGGGHQVDGSGDGHGGRHGVDESRDGHVGGVGDDGASNGRPAKRSRTDVEGGLEGVFDG